MPSGAISKTQKKAEQRRRKKLRQQEAASSSASAAGARDNPPPARLAACIVQRQGGLRVRTSHGEWACTAEDQPAPKVETSAIVLHCFKCGGVGHRKRDCPGPEGEGLAVGSLQVPVPGQAAAEWQGSFAVPRNAGGEAFVQGQSGVRAQDPPPAHIPTPTPARASSSLMAAARRPRPSPAPRTATYPGQVGGASSAATTSGRPRRSSSSARTGSERPPTERFTKKRSCERLDALRWEVQRRLQWAAVSAEATATVHTDWIARSPSPSGGLAQGSLQTSPTDQPAGDCRTLVCARVRSHTLRALAQALAPAWGRPCSRGISSTSSGGG